MYRLTTYLFIAFVSLTFFGCKKDCIDECKSLKASILENNNENLKSILTSYVTKLPSQDYNQQNLSNLISKISEKCDITGELVCFDCIMTLPSASEIKLSFIENGTTRSKTIDISHTSENIIKIVGMHD